MNTACIHRCFVEFLFDLAELLRDGGVCSSVASTGGLGFPGGSLGWVRSKLALNGLW